MIMYTYLVYRRRRPQLHETSKFKMPFSKVMPYVVLVFFALMLVALSLDAETRLGLYVAPIWFVGLALAWKRNSKTARQQARIQEWKTMETAEKAALTR
jgi:D-serine/D-alanine/glycine transporter